MRLSSSETDNAYSRASPESELQDGWEQLWAEMGRLHRAACSRWSPSILAAAEVRVAQVVVMIRAACGRPLPGCRGPKGLPHSTDPVVFSPLSSITARQTRGLFFILLPRLLLLFLIVFLRFVPKCSSVENFRLVKAQNV